MMKLLATSEISTTNVLKNEVQLYDMGVGTFRDQASELYKKLEMKYPKFFKMDEVCKLATLAAEVLHSNTEVSELGGEDVGVILATNLGCLSADKKHRDSYINPDKFFPSPAVFVYTLPNIMLGEICIKYKITGESTCLMMDSFDKKLVNTYVSDLINREKYRYCVAGWIDFSEGNYSAKLSLYCADELENK